MEINEGMQRKRSHNQPWYGSLGTHHYNVLQWYRIYSIHINIHTAFSGLIKRNGMKNSECTFWFLALYKVNGDLGEGENRRTHVFLMALKIRVTGSLNSLSALRFCHDTVLWSFLCVSRLAHFLLSIFLYGVNYTIIYCKSSWPYTKDHWG